MNGATAPGGEPERLGEITFPVTGRRVWVAGHRGMVGSALVRKLAALGCEVVTATRGRVDLRRQAETEAWLAEARPEAVFLAAAKVGGILANDTYPAQFLYDNLMIEANVVEAARRVGVAKLMILGSTCVYPKLAPQPLSEDALLTGPLELTNEWYAVAKIAGIKLAQAYRRQYGCDFISVMPTNLYGPGDNYDPVNSHVAAALIRKVHEARAARASEVVLWGTGTPRREFLYVDDLADACVYLMERYSAPEIVNIGVGHDITIRDFAETVARVIGWSGRFAYDSSKPDGTPRKLVDVSRLNGLGWRAKTSLEDGLRRAYADFLSRVEAGKLRLAG